MTEGLQGKRRFPPGGNIKAPPTGNALNLPRLPPWWGTRSTMSRKMGQVRNVCARIDASVHKQTCALVNPETDAGRQDSILSVDWAERGSGCSLLVLPLRNKNVSPPPPGLQLSE